MDLSVYKQIRIVTRFHDIQAFLPSEWETSLEDQEEVEAFNCAWDADAVLERYLGLKEDRIEF